MEYRTLRDRITFTGPVARLNYLSKDGRALCHPGKDVGSRELPLPLMSHTPDADRPGCSVVQGIGTVEELWTGDGNTGLLLIARGSFNTDSYAWHVAGALAIGAVNLQLDTDRPQAHVIMTESETDSPILLLTEWRVTAVTVSSGPNAWDLPRATVRFPAHYAPRDAG